MNNKNKFISSVHSKGPHDFPHPYGLREMRISPIFGASLNEELTAYQEMAQTPLDPEYEDELQRKHISLLSFQQ